MDSCPGCNQGVAQVCVHQAFGRCLPLPEILSPLQGSFRQGRSSSTQGSPDPRDSEWIPSSQQLTMLTQAWNKMSSYSLPSVWEGRMGPLPVRGAFAPIGLTCSLCPDAAGQKLTHIPPQTPKWPQVHKDSCTPPDGQRGPHSVKMVSEVLVCPRPRKADLQVCCQERSIRVPLSPVEPSGLYPYIMAMGPAVRVPLWKPRAPKLSPHLFAVYILQASNTGSMLSCENPMREGRVFSFIDEEQAQRG